MTNRCLSICTNSNNHYESNDYVSNNNFSILPSQLLLIERICRGEAEDIFDRLGLPHKRRIIVAYMITRMSGNRFFCESHETIARNCSCHRQTVLRTIKDCEGILFSVKRRGRHQGTYKKKTNCYSLLLSIDNSTVLGYFRDWYAKKTHKNEGYECDVNPACRETNEQIKKNLLHIFNINKEDNRLSIFDYYGIAKDNKTASEEIYGSRLESIQSNFFKKARFDSINAGIAVENSRRAAEPLVKGGERQQPGQAAIEFYGSTLLDKHLVKGSRLANSPKQAYFFSTQAEEQGKEMNFDKEKEAKEQILSQLLHEGLLLLDENRKREALTYPVDDIRRSANALRRCKGPLTNAPGYFMKVLTSDNFQGGLRPATSREAPSETMFGTEKRSMRATPKSDRGDESTDLGTVFEKEDRQRAAMGLQPEPKWDYKTDFTGMSDDEVKEAKQEEDRIHLERNHAAYFTRKIERARKFRKEGSVSPDLEVLENEIASFREKQAAGLIKRHAEETNEEKLDKWGKYLESEAGKIAQKMLGHLQPPPLHLPEENERIIREREKREKYMQKTWDMD